MLILPVTLATITAALATAGPATQPSPPTTAQIDTAIQRGVAFLLTVQNKNGSWGSARRTKNLNISAPVPGAHHAFRAAVTGLCVSALIEVGGEDPKVAQSLKRGEAWLIQYMPKLRRASGAFLYNVWGHAYGTRALVRMLARAADDKPRRETIKKLIAQQVDLLSRYETVHGGWNYYDFGYSLRKPASKPASFTTATILIALYEAKQAGIAVPDRLVQRGLATLRRQRMPYYAYSYAEYGRLYPMWGLSRPAGSLGRSQVCNLARRLWGDRCVTDAVLKDWLNRLANRNGWLSMGRKRPVPHESWYGVAGYFFYYGHFYAAGCIQQLAPEDRPPHQGRLANILLQLQEKDGSWWDFPFYDYHQPYGTAFALMSLGRCRTPPDGG